MSTYPEHPIVHVPGGAPAWLRRADATTWQTANPTLRKDEIGFSDDTHELRIGDGETPWNELTEIASNTSISPRDFGAVGDGSTDDTAALQSALNASVAAGATLTLTGRYKTTSSIVLPINTAVSIKSSVADSNPFGPLTQNKASIESTGSSVFTQSGAGNVFLTLQDVNIRNLGASNSTVFSGVTLNTSTVTGCTTAKFGYIFDATSNVTQVTRINGNRFENIGIIWAAGSVIDAFVTENYMNGDPSKNATFLTGNTATSLFADNYIDFFKRVIDVPNGNIGNRWVGNIFDYCWNTLGSSSGQNLNGHQFIGNTWHNCTAANALSYFVNADSDMTGTPWRAIDDGGHSISNVLVLGNAFTHVDCAIRVRGGLGAFRESGNTYSSTVAGMVDVKPSFFISSPNDLIVLEAMEQQVTAPTFAAAQTIDWSISGIQTLTLTGNITSLGFSNGITGRVYELHLIQDGTGSRTLSSPGSNIHFNGGSPVLTSAPGIRDVFRFRYDGSNYNEISRAFNVGDPNQRFMPMGTSWQVDRNGTTDWVNGTSAYPFVRVSSVFNTGPGTYGGVLFGRGNVAPDTSLARGNDNQPSLIANASWLKKISSQTLAVNGGVNFNPYTADTFVINLQANATSLTFSTTATSTGYAQEIRVEFVQDSTGSRTLSGASSAIKWAGGSAPTLTTTANKRDIFTFRYDQSATAWYEVARSMNVG